MLMEAVMNERIKSKIKLTQAQSVLFYMILVIALNTLSIRLNSVLTGSDNLADTRWYVSKVLMIVLPVLSLLFHLFTPMKANFKSLRPSWKELKKPLLISAVISIVIIAAMLGFRAYMISKDPSLKEVSKFGLYLNMNMRWFYPINIPLQEIFIKSFVQDNVSRTFEKKHIHLTVFVTSVLFFIIHMQYPLYYMCGAMVLCALTGYIYEKHPNIWGPVLIHFVIGFLPRSLGILQIIER